MIGGSSPDARPAFAAVFPQDAADDFAAAFKAALKLGDDARASAVLKSALVSEVGREAVFRTGLKVAEDGGRIDLWLAAAKDAADRSPNDAFAQYVTGFVLQRQKLLREADPYLARAVAVAPTVGDYVEAFAWNAFLRFDRPLAAKRAMIGGFAGRDEFLVDARRESASFPIGAATAALIGSALILALALRLVGRAQDVR